MQKFVFVLALLLAACQSSVNQPPGRYRDFADYMIDVDPEIMSDANARGATRAQARCVAENVGRAIHGSNYDDLSAAVSGRARLSDEEQGRMRQQQDAFVQRVRSNPNVGSELINGAWDACT